MILQILSTPLKYGQKYAQKYTQKYASEYTSEYAFEYVSSTPPSTPPSTLSSTPRVHSRKNLKEILGAKFQRMKINFELTKNRAVLGLLTKFGKEEVVIGG